MPTISIFFGIVVQMYWRDHNPPHFHAYYQNFDALFEIETGKVMEGRMPPGARRIVEAWALRHKAALPENWERGRISLPFQTIIGADEE